MNKLFFRWITVAVICSSYTFSYAYDLNGDGYEEIVVSSYYQSDSKVFYGSPTAGYNTFISLPTMYATGNTVADLNKDGYLDIIFCNSSNGTTTNVDSYIYWGGASGYSSGNRTGLPTHGASAVSAYDLNYDGYPDILFSNKNNNSNYQINSYIYWGGQSGFSAGNKLELPTNGAMGHFLADINKDGFIDIIFCNNNDGSGSLVNSFIYWGSESGFSTSNKTELVTQGAVDCSVKDLNKDGYYDIVFSNNFNNVSGAINSYIYWGSESGYSSGNRTGLATRYARANAIADIDNDGYDDIVFCNMTSGTNYHIKSYVYWGSATGFSNDTKTEIDTIGADGVAVADVNGDGHLDIFFSNKTTNGTSPQNTSYLKWGSSTRSFNSTKFLSCGGASGVTMGTNSAFGADYIFLMSQNDQDLDGLPDQWEQRNGTNPYVNDAADDPDNDGLTNLEEYNNNTHPQTSDSDNDGLLDGEEVNIHNSNPLNPDTDGDGIIDGLEVSYGTNPLSADTDSDGMPDKWEIENNLNPLLDDSADDSDNDGLNNLFEYIYQTEPYNSDTDNDGLSDGFEINYQETFIDGFETGDFSALKWFTYSDNEAVWSIGTDSYNGSYAAYASQNSIEWSGSGQHFTTLFFNIIVPMSAELSFYAKTELLENELFRFYVNQEKDNENQGTIPWIRYSKPLEAGEYTFSYMYIYVPDNDSDSFAALDQVSVTYYGLSPLNSDSDNDGLIDGDEINIHGTSPFNPDSDFDGMDDGWEVSYGFNPLIPDSETDSDNDGLLEYEEFFYKTNPFSEDTDNDGMPDKWETENNTDPLVYDYNIDMDNDGLSNGLEFFYGTSADNPDTDGDGIYDGAEINIYNTDPLLMDTDNDGLSDNTELFIINPEINLTGSSTENLYPSIATNGDNYMVTWLHYDNDGNVAKILYNILDKRGNPLLENRVLTNYQSEGSLESSLTTGSGQYIDLNNPSSGNYVNMACRFVAGKDYFCRNISLKLKRSGSPDGSVFVSLNSDGAGGVPGAELTQSALITSASISADGEWVDFYLNTTQQLANGNVYWIVLQTTNSAGANCISWEWLNNSSLKNWSFFNGSNWAPYSNYTVAVLYKVFSTVYPKIEYNQMIPDICSDGTNYFITWQNWHLVNEMDYYGIYGQLISPGGTVLIPPTQINSMPYLEQKSPVCASNGSYYLVSWQMYDPENDTDNIHIQYLNNEGEIVDDEYIVVEGAQNPCLASDGEGFYLSWDEIDNDSWTYLGVSSDSYYYLMLKENDSAGFPGKLLGEIRGPTGERLTEEFQINDNPNEHWSNPKSASNGAFYMVVWETFQNSTGEWDIYGQMLDYSGKKVNTNFQLNHTSALDQKSCAVASADNYFVAVYSSETDNDSLSDILISYIQWGFDTNPLLSDTDNDGMPDGWEINNKLNALADDADGDFDNDGLTNYQEYQHGTYAFRKDTDSDGLPDYDEIMVHGTNPLSKDTDSDGIPDKWEINNNLIPLDNDSHFDPDNDGLINLDEYKNNTNPHISDTDNDGMPDKWEVDHGTNPTVDDADDDLDEDGLTNYEEFILGTHPKNNDYDNDGMTDGYEVYKYFTDPKNADSDNDGLTDYEELLFIDREIMVNDNTGAINTNPVIASNGFNYLTAWKSTDIEGNVCLIKHKLLDVTGKPSSEELVTAYVAAQNAVEYELTTGSGTYLDLNNPSAGNYQEQAARFVAGRNFSCGKIDLKLCRKGSPQGNVFIALYSDSYGFPGTEIVQSNHINASSISAQGEWVSFSLNEIQQLNNGSVYWIVLKSDYTAGSDCVGWEWLNTTPNWSFKTGGVWANYSVYTVSVLYKIYFTFSPLSENNHMRPHVSSDGLNYLVTWQSWEYNEDGGYYKIMGQIVNYSGGIKGEQFRINTATTTYQANPVSSYVGQNFIVFWEFYDEDNDSTDIHSRYVSAYYAQPQGSEYIIEVGHENPKATVGAGISYFIADEVDNDYFQHQAVASDGNLFLELNEVSNGSRQLKAQLFTKDRIPVKEGVIITDNTVYDWNKSDVASNSFNYLAVWDSQNSDGSGWGVKGQFIEQLGGLDNVSMELNYNTAGNQKNCSVASVGLEYIVLWEDDNDSPPTSDIMSGFVKWGIGTDPNNPDTDNDGLPDYWEYINYTDYLAPDADADPDNDGLTNAQEFANGSFAYIVDSDNDGLTDYEEIMVYGTNPVLKDTDNDGMPDKWEIDNNFNPLADDSEYDNDGDGLNNYNEFLYRTDPHNPDTDNDGLLDSQETLSMTSRFKINSYTSGRQHYQASATDGNEYFVVWESNNQDGDKGGIFAQRLDKNGVFIDTEFQVNTYTPNDQWSAVLSSGGNTFLVAWTSEQQDLSESGVYAQTISSGTGGFIGNEIKLNTYTLNDQIYPLAASNGDTYLVCWNSYGQDTNLNGVYGQLVGQSGAKIGGEKRINEFLQNNQEYPQIASNGKNYFVVWESKAQDGDGKGVYARIIDNDGLFFTSEFIVNDYTTGDQLSPVVKSNGKSYLVAWSSANQDGSGSGVYASLFDNEGTEIKPEFKVNVYTSGSQISPMLASDGENYFIAWTSYTVTGADSDVCARITDNEGAFITGELKVNTKKSGLQELLGVSCMGLNYIVVWDSLGEENNYGMFGQIFDRQGDKIGPQFQITDYPLGEFYQPSISYIKSGYLVTFTFREEDNEGDLGVYGVIINSKYNPLNPDYDNDGLLDGDEVTIYNSDPACTDTDGDGISDYDEVMVYGTNPNSTDSDNDGLTDDVELDIGLDPVNPDSDNDGMYDGWEIDNNFDPFVKDGHLDRDNDGVSNYEEFLHRTNPDNPDTDSDGLPDKWEIDNNTDPLVDDSADDPDNDGLSNSQEYALSTRPDLADTDGDGQNDGDEIFASTDPLDPESVFKVAVLTNSSENEITIMWSVELNMDYFIYWTDSLSPLAVWDIVDYPGLDSDIVYDPLTSSSSWTDKGEDPEMNGLKPSEADNRYYKIRVLPK